MRTQHPKQEIHGHRPLMKLVEDDEPNIFQNRIVLNTTKQDAFG